MSPQLVWKFEGLITFVTWPRLLGQVEQHVLLQVRFLGKCFVTLATLVTAGRLGARDTLSITGTLVHSCTVLILLEY